MNYLEDCIDRDYRFFVESVESEIRTEFYPIVRNTNREAKDLVEQIVTENR